MKINRQWTACHKYVCNSVHHHKIQIIQPTKRKSFTSLLLDVYVWLNIFRAPLRPSSEAYNCTRSLWFYRWREVAGALLVVVWKTNSSLALQDPSGTNFACKSFVKVQSTDVGAIAVACKIFLHFARRSCVRKSATSFTLRSSVEVFGLPGLWSSFMVTRPS